MLKSREKLQQLLSLLTCLLMIVAVAINKDGAVGGHKIVVDSTPATPPVEQTSADGTTTITTTSLIDGIMGYGGVIPLQISINDDIITDIRALRNAETPSFLNEVMQRLHEQYIGKGLHEALGTQMDAVSGATLSSVAAEKSFKAGLHYAAEIEPAERFAWRDILDPKFIVTLLVVLSGALLPLFVHSAKFRTVQLLLNIAILGFWSGTFISYSRIVNYCANGINITTSIIPIVLLAVAFIYPLFGRSRHYCTWICPLGSLQEIAGKCTKRKFAPSPKVLHRLTLFRQVLWAVLMLCMWSGVLFELMDYELFSAFLFRQASTVVIAIAAGVVVLSSVIARPYCRFVCPTGTLFDVSQIKK